MFDEEFKSARLEDGKTISFTRLEARALSFMARNPGRTLSRSQILDAVTEPGSDKSDRNIDFLINRVRRKLGDSARDPKFIATRYGEGYVWLWPTQPASAKPESTEDAFVVVGPLRGLQFLGDRKGLGHEIGRRLRDELQANLQEGQRVVLDPGYEFRGPRADEGPVLCVDLTFFSDQEKSGCVIASRSCETGVVIDVRRVSLIDDRGAPSHAAAELRRIAPLILALDWHAKAVQVKSNVPLPVAMRDAETRTPDHRKAWLANDLRLKTLRAENPDDPAIKMMFATHLHSKYILLGRDLFQKGQDTCQADEAEIERLVIESLEYAQSRPELAVMAAKLLYFVDRGYKTLALDLALGAHRKNASIASSLAIVGQLLGFMGDIDAAVKNLRQAEQLADPGSRFHLYVLVMLCQVLVAGGRAEDLAVARKQLYHGRPALALFLEPLFGDPDHPSLRAKGIMLMLSRANATARLRHINYVSARLFERPEHRENTMRTPLGLCIRRFGRGIVPPEVAATVPGLLA